MTPQSRPANTTAKSVNNRTTNQFTFVNINYFTTSCIFFINKIIEILNNNSTNYYIPTIPKELTKFTTNLKNRYICLFNWILTNSKNFNAFPLKSSNSSMFDISKK